MRIIYNRSLLIKVMLVLTLFMGACGDDEPNLENTSSPEEENNQYGIVGSWFNEYFTESISGYDLFVFHEDGSFEKYSKSQYRQFPIKSYTYTGMYSLAENTINFQYKRTDLSDYHEDSGIYSIENSCLSIKKTAFGSFSGNFYKSSFKTLDNIEFGKKYLDNPNKEELIEQNSPYQNYMYSWYSKDKYIELTKVEMQCEHGKGTQANTKYLRFCGPNGSVSPNGAVILTMTPYYEGIDKNWIDGTYKINTGSGYYKYFIHPYVEGHDWTSDESEGTLTIKTNGNIKTFNYKSSNTIIHFVGMVQ